MELCFSLCQNPRRMNIIQRIFGKKSKSEVVLKENDAPVAVQSAASPRAGVTLTSELLDQIELSLKPSVCGENFMALFRSVPEVFWPIDFIAKRISEGHFDLKRVKDDSIVWCNRIGADRILKRPNPVMSWRELVYQHFVYKFVTGNAFFRAAMPDTFSPDALKCQWCENFWELPADKVNVIPMQYSWGIPVFGIASKEELVQGYDLKFGAYSTMKIPEYQIWHDRDGIPNMSNTDLFLKAQSRLMSVKKPIANLIAVYTARNIIYLKRGAIGFIVAQKEDRAGTVALEPDEKESLRNELNKNYGVGDGQAPYGITDVPVDFKRINLSIQELQPFEETLEDAIKIASIFGIPAVLVPRKDQSTFSNQDAAEKSVYTSTIIPSAKRFCEELTTFLGLEEKGLYIDCDFSDVACLQNGLKESEEVKKLINERCLSQFNNGLISINDWRAQIHEDALEGEIYDKVKFEMTPEEIAIVDRVIKAQTSPIQINTGQSGGGKPEDNQDNNNQFNNKPSKGESKNE